MTKVFYAVKHVRANGRFVLRSKRNREFAGGRIPGFEGSLRSVSTLADKFFDKEGYSTQRSSIIQF